MTGSCAKKPSWLVATCLESCKAQGRARCVVLVAKKSSGYAADPVQSVLLKPPKRSDPPKLGRRLKRLNQSVARQNEIDFENQFQKPSKNNYLS